MKLHKGIVVLQKGDWGLGLLIEQDKNWDGSVSGELIIFKIRIWFRIGVKKWGGAPGRAA